MERGCPRAVRRLRLAHRARPRRHLGGRDRGGDRRGDRRRTTEPHRRPHPHRLRQPEQAGQLEGPWGTARRRRGAPHEGGVWLGSRSPVLRAGRGPRGDGRRRRSRPGARQRMGGPHVALLGGVPGGGCRAAPSPRRRAPHRLGGRPAGLRRRRGLRHPPGEPAGDPGPGRPGARIVRRSRRPEREQSHRRQGGRRLRGGRARPQSPFRGPRAWDGRRRERDRLPRRLHPVRRDLPPVQRLHARLGPPRRTRRGPHRLRLDPRFGRPRRGRPHPPADRALRGAAGDPEPVVRAAG